MKAHVLIAIVLFGASAASAKEIKDLADRERAALALAASVECFAKPGSSPAVRAAIGPDGNWKSDSVTMNELEKAKAFLDVLVSSQGLEDACKILFVEDITDKAGSTLPDTPAGQAALQIMYGMKPRPR
jgi:hypothetical protein